jgi:serine/threonine protein phosphatase PrpC
MRASVVSFRIAPLNNQSTPLQIEYSELSLIGGREENQDKVAVITGPEAVMLITVDGMGGHANGALAAKVATETIAEGFASSSRPMFDPQGFMHNIIAEAHSNLVNMSPELNIEFRPRATCVVCLIQDEAAYWGHVGDSRIYLIRNNAVFKRTRDHSHVELLLQEGVITEDEIAAHPMRNYVECCLGGDFGLPGMTLTNQERLISGDTLLLCTDGFWSGLDDEQIGLLGSEERALSDTLLHLGELAVKAGGAHADNTSAVALRWQG